MTTGYADAIPHTVTHDAHYFLQAQDAITTYMALQMSSGTGSRRHRYDFNSF